MAEQATGSNSVPQSESGSDENQEFVTKDQLVTIINSAISARNKGTSKEIADLKAVIAQLTESLAQPKAEEARPAAKVEKQDNSEVAAMRKQLEALTKEREAEKAKAKDLQLRSSVKDELTRVGVTSPAAVKGAMAMLLTDNSVGFNDDGELVYRVDGEETDLSSGMKAWAKTDDAKLFLPARGVNGSGDRNSGQKLSKSSEPDLLDLFNINR